jgi:hypothetical protein
MKEYESRVQSFLSRSVHKRPSWEAMLLRAALGKPMPSLGSRALRVRFANYRTLPSMLPGHAIASSCEVDQVLR